MDFQNALKFLRSELGLTQEELANALQINFSTLARWESGKAGPNRSSAAALIAFARSRAVTPGCMAVLEQALHSDPRHPALEAQNRPSAHSQNDLDRLLQSIVENINGGISVGVFSGDGKTRLAYANDKYYALFGYTKEQFAAELPAHHQMILPEDVSYVADTIQNVKRTRQPATFRYRAFTRDGRVISVRCSSSVSSIEGFGENVLMSVLTDITDSVKAEQQALVFGQRLNAIMGNINNGVAASILHANGAVDYVFVTDRYYEMLGYTREQYHQEVSDPFDLIYKEDADSVRAAVVSLRTINESKNIKYRAVRRDGRVIWLDVNLTMMAFADVSEPVQLSVFTDITHLVEINERLAAQRNQINEMLNTTPGGIATVEVNPQDIRGSMRTTYYNDSFFSYSGYSREEYDTLLRGNEMHFVFEEDVPALMDTTAKICAAPAGEAVDVTIRCHTKDGGYRWLLLTGQVMARREEVYVLNIVLVDITKRKIAEDRQRISEEMLRIAAETDKRALITYDVKANSCHVESRNLFSAKFGETLENIPASLLDTGIASPDSTADLCDLFARIRNGEKNIRVSLLLRTGNQEYQWFECNASSVFDADGRPDHAVLVFHNITEQRLKEAVYKKWTQSIASRPPESFTLFRCNLSKDASLDEQDGKLLRISFPPEVLSFNARTKAYVDQFVYPEDQDAYAALLDSDTLLAMFYRGEHTASLEYREISAGGDARWRLLTVEMVEYLNSADVQIFLMYEDIDEKKKEELKEIERAQTDPLTGVLNRVAFSEKVDALIQHEPSAQHALLMMDMDGFKLLNDTFGHAAGDQALLDTAAIIRSLIRDGDIVCRLGGDEFLVWLRGIPYDAVIDKIARQMCEQVQKAFSQDVQISASIGISVYPRDGHEFDELYHNADKALYKVKKAGKNNYAFFSASEHAQSGEEPEIFVGRADTGKPSVRAKRRMLIVDDDGITRAMLGHIFQEEYLIEAAKNGTEAMLRLRHFSTAISIVLLDLNMPGVDGYEVLRKIQTNVDLRTIPVIVVSGDEDRKTLLRAIECGATDYVTKPVDTELIRLRVKSAVSKAENERLRAQNSYLQLQRDEELKFHTVLESTGTVVVEYDWRNHVFVYANEISKYIAGNYNHRSLWQVFLSDMVAESADVKALQDAILMLANNRIRSKFSKLVALKTPENYRHWFRMNVYKQVDAFGLAEKMIITFNDVHEEVLSNEKLLFQATRDELTGLYNRAGFIEKAAELIAAKEPGYYVMSCIDIEKFKVINDQYGTEKGDEILRQFAACLTKFHSKEGAICCRLMADNFAVLCPSYLIGTKALESSHRAVERLDGSLPPLKFYVGRCVIDDKSLSISAIYDRAAIAKDTVKGRYDTYIATYNESMRTVILRQQEITGQMKHALETGQFEAWLQPQFNHATGTLSGAEALVRWRHPKEGIISPAEFIPIFERNGFVYEVDQFVWEETCKLLRKWLDQGLNPVPVSVNISRYDVFRDDLIPVIKGLVQKYNLPRDLLRLEITESAFSESSDQIIRVVKEFMELGFVVEIDDFGSGYSSLNTLKDVPAQILKMDMKFLENDSNAQRGGSIIESVVRMAKWLGMSVIAEGVESIEQADYLKSIGCEYVQGYLYSRPMQAFEYEKIFADGRTEFTLRKLDTVETWNNNAFWNPKSIETLIFNSYVGGACIFEYQHGKTELLRYNDGYAEIFQGFIDRDAINERKDILLILDAENARLVKENIETAIQTKKEASCECRYENDGNRVLFVRTTVRQIAQAGDRSLFYCVVADITAQRAAERREREAASRMATILDHMNSGITAVCTKNGRPEMIFSNDRYYAQLGYTREQFAAELPVYFNAIYPADRARVYDRVRQTLASKASSSLEYRCVKRDGSLAYIRSNIALCHIDGINGDVIVTVETDISELVATQRKENNLSIQLQAIMANIHGGITASLYHAIDRLEIFFSNDGFYDMYGYTREQFMAEVPNALDLVLPEDRPKIMETVARIVRERGSATYEYRCRRRDGSIVWIQCHNTVISLDGIGDTVLLAVTNDITKEEEANEQLQFLNKTAHDILAQADSEKAIEDILVQIRDYFGCARAYIMEDDAKLPVTHNSYEVCAPGVSSVMAMRQNLPIGLSGNRSDEYVEMKDIASSTASKSEFRELLLGQGVKSTVIIPLHRNGVLFGTVGIDNPSKEWEQVDRLKALGDYIAVLLTRRDLSRNIERGNADLRQLLNDAPGGFCRFSLCPGDPPALVSMNQGFCSMLDMTEEEIRAACAGDIYRCFVKEDIDASVRDARSARDARRQYTAECRIRRKDGELIWVMAYGRFIKDDAGGIFLNVYFTEISEQKKAEELRGNLMDNLPCGAALYEYDNGKLSVIHINKRYWELVDRAPVDYRQASVMDVIYPDDRGSVRDEVESAIRQKRNAQMDIRIRFGSEGYKPFHVSANILPNGDGKYMLAVSYTPISEQAISLQDMLPIALSTLMATSEDISFIKDQEGRYIACSRSAISVMGLGSERDVIGKTSTQVFGDEAVKKSVPEDERVYQTGKPLIDREIKLTTPKGEAVVFRTSKYPLLDGAGKVVGIYCICRNVTEEKATEFELNTLLRVIPSGVFKYSADEKAEFAYINRSFIESLGYTEAQFHEKFHHCFLEMIWKEDRARAEAEILAQESEGNVGRFDYRVEAADGQLHWFHDEGVKVADDNGREWYYVTLVDITAQRKSEASLRLAEEEYRLATRHSGHTIGRYDVKSRTLTITEDAATRLALPECIPDVPYGRVRLGKISEDTSAAYIAFYENIMRGEKEGTVTFKKLLSTGWCWITEHSTTIFDEEGAPVSAIISYKDVTDQQEKELAYKRWQQSMKGRDPNTYTLFRCNLNENTSYDLWEGKLLSFKFGKVLQTFNGITAAYAEQCVYEADQARYRAFVNSDTMLAEYYRGHRSDALEYREKQADGNVRWLKLSVDLVESPHSRDVEAYLLYENIDETKKAELEALHMAETDPLTGLLNRKAFSARANEVMQQSRPGTRHAFLMLDIDGFKMLNDTFGHAAGDEALIEIAHQLQTLLRKGDLLARLGGDEFVIFLNDIAENMSIGKKAQQICQKLLKTYSAEIQLSASVGISLYPQDGTDSHTLYEKADIALYAAKESGRNAFRIYAADMPEKGTDADSHAPSPDPAEKNAARVKRRMLIVDPSPDDRAWFKGLLQADYLVDFAPDGQSALTRIRYYGSALSLVLLDTQMPGTDGFDLLKRIRNAPEMRGVPIIVVSEAEDRETMLHAIRCGADDFVAKPVDPEILWLRISAAISRADNERLRAQNSFLHLRGEEAARYQTALNDMGLFVVEMDWVKGTFVYDPAISSHLKGTYDERTFFRILLSDLVADALEVKKLQDFLHQLADDHDRDSDHMEMTLKTPANAKRRFGIRAKKITDDNGLTRKLLLTFQDPGQDELPGAAEK